MSSWRAVRMAKRATEPGVVLEGRFGWSRLSFARRSAEAVVLLRGSVVLASAFQLRPGPTWVPIGDLSDQGLEVVVGLAVYDVSLRNGSGVPIITVSVGSTANDDRVEVEWVE